MHEACFTLSYSVHLSNSSGNIRAHSHRDPRLYFCVLFHVIIRRIKVRNDAETKLPYGIPQLQAIIPVQVTRQLIRVLNAPIHKVLR